MEVDSLPFPLVETGSIEGSASDLSSLPVGETAVVSRIHTDGLLRRRLLDLGFVPSTRVESVRRSPGGDPTIYRVRGAKVALRKSDAKLIE
ncbi:MAG: ferrous iron transport protein A, partial [Candidatus Omnitrophica bacterium]|nr:ferrous iron transport protein A [Candidatus Omnitrophota bacterium]